MTTDKKIEEAAAALSVCPKLMLDDEIPARHRIKKKHFFHGADNPKARSLGKN